MSSSDFVTIQITYHERQTISILVPNKIINHHLIPMFIHNPSLPIMHDISGYTMFKIIVISNSQMESDESKRLLRTIE
jgi:hypothetical protein